MDFELQNIACTAQRFQIGEQCLNNITFSLWSLENKKYPQQNFFVLQVTAPLCPHWQKALKIY